MSEKRQSSAARIASNTGTIATKAFRKTGEHRIAEFGLALFGVALAAGGFVLLYVQGKDIGLVVSVIASVMLIGGVSLIPGAAVRAASGIGKIGGAVAEAWKKKS